MSLVGTRPPTLDEWEKYEPHHRARMSFRPGLTGLWQVSGRSNITDFEEVVKLDTQYIGEWSVKLCISIKAEICRKRFFVGTRHILEQNMTQKDLSAKTGITQADISRIENGMYKILFIAFIL